MTEGEFVRTCLVPAIENNESKSIIYAEYKDIRREHYHKGFADGIRYVIKNMLLNITKNTCS